MNCDGCHGTSGGGGMEPNLKDVYWRYGGTIPPDKAEEALVGIYQGTVAIKSSASPIVGGYPIEGQ